MICHRRAADIDRRAEAERELQAQNRQLEDQGRLLDSLQNLGQTILASLDIDRLLDNLGRETVRAGIFRSLMVALVDRRNLHVEVACGFVNRRDGDRRLAGTVQRVTDASTGRRYGLQDGNITAEVARSGRLEVIEEWDDRFDDKVDTPESRRGNVSYFIPIKKGEQVLAVL